MNSEGFVREILDAVVVSTNKYVSLCLNTYSKRLDRLRSSHLAKKFGSQIIDPIEQEKTGKFLIADTKENRKDSQKVLDYITKKYGLQKAITLTPKRYSCEVYITIQFHISRSHSRKRVFEKKTMLGIWTKYRHHRITRRF